MHFRERNRVVQVIRTTYDPKTQKGKPEIVARLIKTRPAIADDVRKICNADELREIEAWIAANRATLAVGPATRLAAGPAPRKIRGQAKANRAAMMAAAQIGIEAGVTSTRPAKPQRTRGPAVVTPWSDPKAGAKELIAQLDQATLWFRRNTPTEERKALAAGLALSMHRVRTVLRKKGWIAQKSGA